VEKSIQKHARPEPGRGISQLACGSLEMMVGLSCEAELHLKEPKKS